VRHTPFFHHPGHFLHDEMTHWGKNQLFIQKFPWLDVSKMWILWKMRLWKCEFCENWDFEIVNLVKNDIVKLWIWWKMRFWKCEFSEKWDFEIVNCVKIDILKLWILWKLRFWNCEFGEKWDFECEF